MGWFMESLKAGAKGFMAADEPVGYSVAGRPVRCPHCGHGLFATGRALLNTRVRSAFNVDWADPGAAYLVCAECSRIEWFASAPVEMSKPA